MPDPADIAAFRYGHGLPLPEGAPVTAVAMLERLAGPDRAAALWPAPGPQDILDRQGEAALLRRALRKDPDRRPEYRDALAAVMRQSEGFARRLIARSLDTPDGLRERLAWFWSDHFTTGVRFRHDLELVGGLHEHSVRPHLAGRFADMLRAALLHPAMLLYLDQNASIGPNSPAGRNRGAGLNENLAREAIELHTLGVGAAYAQEDVRQLAELLTGVTHEPGKGMVFEDHRAEPGAETVLGRSYSGEGLAPVTAVLADLARRPETARHLSRKLVVHFLSDSPDPALVERMAAAYLAADTALLPVYEVMLRDPAAFAGPMAKARQPIEFVIASLRALGLGGAAGMALGPKPFRRRRIEPLRGMGQAWAAPSGPDGWPEEIGAWITPQGLGARIAWSMETPALLLHPLSDPHEMAGRCLGSLGSEVLLAVAGRSETRREAVGLILSAPEFNRR
ncbi:MAG: DUF1800 domain-containing protein [Gemmobacter sp.]|jgi:uncharacterized protein (DUF1800 family)|nr:DUF1800 domain-containing protein [Gemmobacter sp.]